MSDLERKLYVCGLPQDINEGELKDVFGVYGRLEEVVVLPAKPGTGVDRPDRTGFVKFIEKDEASAAMAILHDMYKFRDASVDAIRVSWARSNRDNRDDSKGSKGGCSGGKGGSMPPVLAPPPAALPPPPAPAPGGKGCGGFSGGKGSAPAGGEKLWLAIYPATSAMLKCTRFLASMGPLTTSASYLRSQGAGSSVPSCAFPQSQRQMLALLVWPASNSIQVMQKK